MSNIPTRILLVDDEPSARASLGEILKLEGYAVTVASGGDEAIELLGVQPFDIVLTDLKMPGQDGLAVLEASTEHQPKALVILLTAFGTLETAVSAMREGGFDYLLKPAEPPQILAAIERAQKEMQEKSRRERLLNQMALTLQELKGPLSSAEEGDKTRVIGTCRHRN